MAPTTAQSPPAARTSRQKSTLFCPECWHSSPVDGDWRVQATADGETYDCPDCGATVTTRQTDGASRSQERDSSTTSTSAGGSLLARSVRLAFAWTAWPCTSPDEMTLPLSRDGRVASSSQDATPPRYCHP